MISPLVGVTTEFSSSLALFIYGAVPAATCTFTVFLPETLGQPRAQFGTWRDGGLHPPTPSPPSGLIVHSNLIQPHLKKKKARPTGE